MNLAEQPEDIPHLFAKFWNEKDAHALASLFVEDADFVNVVGLWWHNRQDIKKAHHYGLTTFFRASTLVVRRTKLRRVSDDVAVVHARCRLSDQLDPDGQTLEPRFAILVFVVQRFDAGWQVITAQNTDIVPGMETNVVRDNTITPMDYRKPQD